MGYGARRVPVTDAAFENAAIGKSWNSQIGHVLQHLTRPE
jgi:hypothetical protein